MTPIATDFTLALSYSGCTPVGRFSVLKEVDLTPQPVVGQHTPMLPYSSRLIATSPLVWRFISERLNLFAGQRRYSQIGNRHNPKQIQIITLRQ